MLKDDINNGLDSQDYDSDLFDERVKKLDNYYKRADIEHISDMADDKCGDLINFDMSIDGNIIKCILDTSRQINCISSDIINKYGLIEYVDTFVARGGKKIKGISGAHGFIPYLPVYIDKYPVPSCFVVTSMEYDCVVGISFMEFYDISIDFETTLMNIGNSRYKGDPISFTLS